MRGSLEQEGKAAVTTTSSQVTGRETAGRKGGGPGWRMQGDCDCRETKRRSCPKSAVVINVPVTPTSYTLSLLPSGPKVKSRVGPE